MDVPFSRPERRFTPTQLVVCSACLIVASMPVSPFMLSVGMWGLVFSALWRCSLEVSAQGSASRGWKHGWEVLVLSFSRFYRNKPLALLSLLLIIPLVSGLWSADQAYWLERVRVRVPFVVLPWVFANLPLLTQRHYDTVLYVLVWTMTLLGIGVCVNYVLHEKQILEAMEHGKPIPVPRHHIRFSLMVATAILAGGWLWIHRFVWRYAWERVVLAAALLFLIGFIHFLSVRSGLAVLYAGALVGLVQWVWHSGRWKAALGFLLGSVIIAWISFQLFPSMQQKWAIRYMIGNTISTRMEQIILTRSVLCRSKWAGCFGKRIPGWV